MITIDKGYELITDYTNGTSLAIERSTGEVFETVTRTVPVGTIFYMPEQQRAYKERQAKKDAKIFKKEQLNALGTFCFVSSEQKIENIKAETLARLVFLSTYAKYDTGQLWLTQRRPMHRSALPGLLKLSPATTSRFLADANNYITEDNDGSLWLSTDTFCKGKLPSNQYKPYQQVYIDAMRSLYLSSSVNEHRLLGYIFQLLPYINVENNILCFNPEETDINSIQAMSINEFCNSIGHTPSTFYRLKSSYSKITLFTNGKEERFCSFINVDTKQNDVHIYINPHVIYSGTNYKLVEDLGSF